MTSVGPSLVRNVKMFSPALYFQIETFEMVSEYNYNHKLRREQITYKCLGILTRSSQILSIIIIEHYCCYSSSVLSEFLTIFPCTFY